MTKRISSCCSHVKISFTKVVVSLVKTMNKPLKEMEKHHVFCLFCVFSVKAAYILYFIHFHRREYLVMIHKEKYIALN